MKGDKIDQMLGNMRPDTPHTCFFILMLTQWEISSSVFGKQ